MWKVFEPTMRRAYRIFIGAVFIGWAFSMSAQVRPLGVCEALNSVEDRQQVVIRAAVRSTRHGIFLFEGTGQDPCPGWPARLFTAPATIPLLSATYPGVGTSIEQARKSENLALRLRRLQASNPASLYIVTVRGVILRKRLLLTVRFGDGSYCCGGFRLDGSYAALLAVTAILDEP